MRTSTPTDVDHPSDSPGRRRRLALLAALVSVAILLSGVLPAPAGAAGTKPKVSAGTIQVTQFCSDDGGESVCTSVSHGTMTMLTINGSRFTSNGLVSIQVVRNFTILADEGSLIAGPNGTFAYETDVRVCTGGNPLPVTVQAYDWLKGRWSNLAVFAGC